MFHISKKKAAICTIGAPTPSPDSREGRGEEAARLEESGFLNYNNSNRLSLLNPV